MAQVVDAAGKVKSFIKPGGRTGGAALWEDLGGNGIVPRSSGGSTGGAALQQALQDAMEQRPVQRSSQAQVWSTPQSYEVPASSPLNLPAPISSSAVASPINAVQPEEVAVSAPQGLANSTGQALMPSDEGVLTPSDLGTVHKAGLDAWEQMAAEREARPVRTRNIFDEEYEGGDSSLMAMADNQLKFMGNTPATDTYLRDMLANGYTMDDLWVMMHGWGDSLDDEEKTRQEHPTIHSGLFDSTVEKLDEAGAEPNYWRATSDTMTGQQYLHYRDDLGMGGREGYIDPWGTYSKRMEANDYGFIPFTPNASSYGEMTMGNVANVPGRAGRFVSNLRQVLTPDYGISYDEGGKRRSISGDDFDRNANAFMNQFYYGVRTNPNQYLTNPNDPENFSTQVREFALPDADGGTSYHYGHVVDVRDVGNNRTQFAFSDGSVANAPTDWFMSVYNPATNAIDYESWSKQKPLDQILGQLDPSVFARDRHFAMIDQYEIPDINGEPTLHYGNIESVEDSPVGGVRFTFTDGSYVDTSLDYFDSVYDPESGQFDSDLLGYSRVWVDDANADIEWDESDLPTYDINNADLLYYPKMRLSDGSTMNLNDVERLLMDKGAGDDVNENGLSDDDIEYSFSGLFGLPTNLIPWIGISNKPTRLMNQEPISKDGEGIPLGPLPFRIDPTDIGNNTLDWTLGSLPISIPGAGSWLYSASNALGARGGIDPNSYNPATRSWNLRSGMMDENGNVRFGEFMRDENGQPMLDDHGHVVSKGGRNADLIRSSMLGNLVVPVTEQLVGPLGSGLLPLEKIAEKLPINSFTGRTLAGGLVNAGGEAIEELLGNPFEEATAYGGNAYATPILNDEGEPMTDEYGHEVRDENTPAAARLANFAGDTENNLNAMLGGALVSAMMNSLGAPGALGNSILADRRRIMNDRAGLPTYLSLDEIEDLGEDYASLFDNAMVRNDNDVLEDVA